MPKIDVNEKARKALEIEATILNKSNKELASDLILKGISKRTLEFLGENIPRTEEKPKTAKVQDIIEPRTAKKGELPAEALEKKFVGEEPPVNMVF